MDDTVIVEGSVLLLLAERSDHGYALVRRLGGLGIDVSRDPGALYRRLAAMERRGLVEHRMCRSDKGPARKVYLPTTQGAEALDDWARRLGRTIGTLQTCLALHARLRD